MVRQERQKMSNSYTWPGSPAKKRSPAKKQTLPACRSPIKAGKRGAAYHQTMKNGKLTGNWASCNPNKSPRKPSQNQLYCAVKEGDVERVAQYKKDYGMTTDLKPSEIFQRKDGKCVSKEKHELGVQFHKKMAMAGKLASKFENKMYYVYADGRVADMKSMNVIGNLKKLKYKLEEGYHQLAKSLIISNSPKKKSPKRSPQRRRR